MSLALLDRCVSTRNMDGDVTLTRFLFNDGGRQAEGFKGSTGDCCCRAVAIATGLQYRTIYDTINDLAKRERTGRRKKGKSSARDGVYRGLMPKLLDALGVNWRWVPTMQIGSGCKVHVNADELPTGRLILNLSRHFSCMIDGLIHDTHDPSRGGTRCVYGYWQILKWEYQNEA